MHHFFVGNNTLSGVVIFSESTGVPISHVCHFPTTVVKLKCEGMGPSIGSYSRACNLCKFVLRAG